MHSQFLAHLYLYLHFMASFDVFGWILFGVSNIWMGIQWVCPSLKENNMQIILFHLNYLDTGIAQFVNGPAVTIAFLDLCGRTFYETRIVIQ